MLSRKNGAQHNTNVKNTNPRTLLAFCSVATAFAVKDLFFIRLARNLEEIFKILKKSIEIFVSKILLKKKKQLLEIPGGRYNV